VREGEGEEVLVVLNAAPHDQRVPLPLDLGSGWRPVFGHAPEGAADAFPDVRLPASEGRVWARGGS
jgi:hypothetical protein